MLLVIHYTLLCTAKISAVVILYRIVNYGSFNVIIVQSIPHVHNFAGKKLTL